MRVPAFVYAPGLLATGSAGARYDGLMHHVDLLPTFVAAAGGRIPPNAVDGVDQWGAITRFADEHASLASVGLDTKVLSAATWGPRDEIVFALSSKWVALRVGHDLAARRLHDGSGEAFRQWNGHDRSSVRVCGCALPQLNGVE